jgi:hypothetical protein
LSGLDFQIDLPDFGSFKEGIDNPRIQQRPNDLLVVWSVPHRFDEQSGRLESSLVLIIFGGKWLVTVHSDVSEMKQVRDDFKDGSYENPLYSILDATALADLGLSMEVSRDIDSYLDSIMDGGRKPGTRAQKERHQVRLRGTGSRPHGCGGTVLEN